MDGTSNQEVQTDITGPIVAAIGQFNTANIMNITGESKKPVNNGDYPINSFSYISR
jgi:hypothetical protein